MSNQSINPPADLTLAELLDMVVADTDLPPKRRDELASAIRATSSWFVLALSAIPAAPSFLRERYKRLSSGGLGVSKKRIQNVRSSIKFALEHYGLGRRRRYPSH